MSIQAWIRRAYDLDIITESHYHTLYINLSQRGWRKNEPFQFRGEERPCKLKQMALHALAEGIITPTKAKALCPDYTETEYDQDAVRKEMPLSPKQVMRLPKNERNRILADSTETAQDEYAVNTDLTDFDAFAEEDIIDE